MIWPLRYLAVIAAIAVSLAFQDVGGLPPHDSGSSYQAYREADEATIAASMIPPGKAAKLFTSEVSGKYIVVEIAVYPRPGHDVDIRMLDFELKSASGGKSHPANPDEVAAVWAQNRPQLPNRAQVVTQGGVEYGSAVNPTTGRIERGWATSAGSGVGNRSAVYGTGPGAPELGAKLMHFALPKGRTNRAIAGYLYFPVLKRTKNDAPEIDYLQRSGESISLRLHP
jgi:hypothetical protein